MKTRQRITIAIVSGAAFAATTGNAVAQIGSGWTRKSFSENLHTHHTGGANIENHSPAPSSYSDDYVSYKKSGELRTFVFKNTTAGRCEIRVNNNYTSGQFQFEGYVNFSRPSSRLSDYTGTYVFQDFGAATHAAWKMKMRSDGSFRAEHGELLAGGAYGVTYRVNFVHNMGSKTIQAYINGSKKVDGADEGGSSHYTKFGMYGGHFVGRATWNNVKYFRK